jgi:pimeloyl-ACP methyl ester carboxylesterase
VIEALRTPEERFERLPGWPYEPRYVEDLEGYAGLRMHYVDEGPRDARVAFVCLHGEPTWGYLYRRMLPVFTAAGHRVIAPDLFGFGRSDKPVADAAYSFGFHRDALKRFLEILDLHDICLVVQDWGGLLGLTLPMDYRDRIRRLIVMNTGLGTGRSPGPGFEAWRAYAAAHPDLDVAGLMRRTCPQLAAEEAAAYGAPFPDVRYKAGVRRFPELVPTRPDMPGVETSLDAAAFLSTEWRGESFMAIGMTDPVLGEPVMRALQRKIRGCPEPMLLPEAGHFVQEWGEPVARAALSHFGLDRGA